MSGLSENAFLHQVLELLTMYDWIWHHDDSSSRLIQRPGTGALIRIANTKRGFPDLCAARIADGRVIFAELKRDQGIRGGTKGRELEPDQLLWERALRANASRPGSTIEYYLWRPADLEDIVRILAR